MRIHKTSIGIKELLYSWNSAIREFPETTSERIWGFSIWKVLYVKVVRKTGYKNPMLYNGMVCILKNAEDLTSVYEVRLYGIVNFPDLVVQWLSIWCFLMWIRPEGIPISNIAWFSCAITAGIMAITALYSRYSLAGKNEDVLLRSFLNSGLPIKERTQ